MNKESIDYQDVKHKEPIVYVIQELPGTSIGRPKFNIMGALKYGKLKVLLKENAQIVLSPGPVIFELRRLLNASSLGLSTLVVAQLTKSE